MRDPLETSEIADRVSVTRLGLGTAPLGGMYSPVSEEQAVTTVLAALDAGIGLIDTAPLYGSGVAERRVGLALSKTSAVPTISTKVGRMLRSTERIRRKEQLFHSTSGLVAEYSFAAEDVRSSISDSKARLGVDRIDLAHVHGPLPEHYDEVIQEALPTLQGLRDQGEVGAISVGMTAWEPLVRFVETGELDAVMLAGRFTLLDQSAGEDFLGFCVDSGVKVLAAGVFNSGILAGSSPTFDYQPADEDTIAKVSRIESVCREFNVPLAAAAIQYPFSHPAVTSVVIGARSAAEVLENLRLARVTIPSDLWAALKAEHLLSPTAPVP